MSQKKKNEYLFKIWERKSDVEDLWFPVQINGE